MIIFTPLLLSNAPSYPLFYFLSQFLNCFHYKPMNTMHFNHILPLSISLFFLPPPTVSPSSIHSSTYGYVHFFFRFSLRICKKTLGICLSECGIFHLNDDLPFHQFAVNNNFILLYGWIFHCVYIGFIHSATNGYLCWLHNLAFVKSAALNIYVQISLWCADLHFFGYMPKSVSSIFFWGTSILTSTVAGLIYISTNGV